MLLLLKNVFFSYSLLNRIKNSLVSVSYLCVILRDLSGCREQKLMVIESGKQVGLRITNIFMQRLIQANFYSAKHYWTPLPRRYPPFWNICSNLNFKEHSFYPLLSIFRQNYVYRSKIFFTTNHVGVRD